jgi:exosortase
MTEFLQGKPVGEQQITAVILIGPRDFGRCPLATRLNKALWPIADKPIVQRLIEDISNQGIKKFVICYDGTGQEIRQTLDINSGLDVRFLDESLPRGPAGCVLDAARDSTNELLLIFNSSMIAPPGIDAMVETHRKAGADMTIIFSSTLEGNGQAGKTAQVYICGRSILEHIPQVGYCDIKEGLIPKLVQAGKTIHAVSMPFDMSSFRTWREYLASVGGFLKKMCDEQIKLPGYRQYDSEGVWVSSFGQVDSSARIFGPVIISDGARICEDVVIFGPAIIGRNAIVGRTSLVADSVLWEDVRIGTDCQVRNCLLDYKAVVENGEEVEDKLVIGKQGRLADGNLRVLEFIKDWIRRLQSLPQVKSDEIKDKLPSWAQSKLLQKQALTVFGAVIVLLLVVWAYWKPTVVDLWKIWMQSDEYSSGMLVPLIAAYIVWLRRKDIMACPIRPSIWGLFALVGAQALRFFGLFFMYASAERISLVLTIVALVLLLFGWKLFWKVSSVLLFLFLMLPLPNRIQMAVTLPLQDWATSSAVFCLEATRYEVIREGNIININGTMVAVVEACNGLRMLTAFFVISGFVVLLVQRQWWEKLIILISSVPIGLLCNTLRLTVTALVFTKIDAQYWEKAFHDYGGLAMMPLALGIVVFELWLLSNLVIEPKSKVEQIVVKNFTR